MSRGPVAPRWSGRRKIGRESEPCGRSERPTAGRNPRPVTPAQPEDHSMRKFLTATFAAAAFAMAAPAVASASPMAGIGGKVAVVDTKPSAGTDFSNCYCGRVYYYRTYRVRYYYPVYRYRVAYRVWYY